MGASLCFLIVWWRERHGFVERSFSTVLRQNTGRGAAGWWSYRVITRRFNWFLGSCPIKTMLSTFTLRCTELTRWSPHRLGSTWATIIWNLSSTPSIFRENSLSCHTLLSLSVFQWWGSSSRKNLSDLFITDRTPYSMHFTWCRWLKLTSRPRRDKPRHSTRRNSNFESRLRSAPTPIFISICSRSTWALLGSSPIPWRALWIGLVREHSNSWVCAWGKVLHAGALDSVLLIKVLLDMGTYTLVELWFLFIWSTSICLIITCSSSAGLLFSFWLSLQICLRISS